MFWEKSYAYTLSFLASDNRGSSKDQKFDEKEKKTKKEDLCNS